MNKKETAEKILSYYIEKLNPDVRYRYKPKARLHLGKLLKKYTEEQLIHSVNMYCRVKQTNFTKSPAYFFSTSERGKDYYFFLDFLEMKEQDVQEFNKPRKKIVVTEGEDILDQFFQ